MDGLILLGEANGAGLKVTAEGGRLIIRGPRRAEHVAQRLLAHKGEVLIALTRLSTVPKPPSPQRGKGEVSETTGSERPHQGTPASATKDPMVSRHREGVDEVPAHHDAIKSADVEAPSLDHGLEEEPDKEHTPRFLPKDLPNALNAMEAWKPSSTGIVAGASQEKDGADFAAVGSDLLGDEILFIRDDQVQVPERYAPAVRYTLMEPEKIQGLDEDELRALHAAKKALGGMVVSGPEVPEGPPEVVQAIEDAALRLGGERLGALANDPAIPSLDRAVYSAEIGRRLSVPIDGIPLDYSCVKRHRSWGMHRGSLVCRTCNPQAEPINGPWNPGVHAMFARAGDGVCPYPKHRRWRSTSGLVICGTCHPPTHPSLVAAWLGEEKEIKR